METKLIRTFIALCVGSIHSIAKDAGYVYYGKRYTTDQTKYIEVPSGIGPYVTMCWESNSPTIQAPNGNIYNFDSIRTAVQNVVEWQWVKYAKIHFLWKTYHSDLDCDVEIHFISSDDELGYVEGRGGWLSHDLYLNIDWMVPITETAWRPTKMNMRQWWNSTSTTMSKRKSTQYGLLQELALHEFGHIVGFSHEHLRTKEGREEYDRDVTPAGDREIGAYDKFSIMNYFRLFAPDAQNPNPKLSCGDVASARVLYGPSTLYPDLAPNCYEQIISKAPLQNLTDPQFTNWVDDLNLNTTSKTIGLSENPPIVSITSITQVSKAYVENVSVNVIPASNPPGYMATFGLRDMNFSGVSCSMPVSIIDLKLHTIEKSWNHSSFYNTDRNCQGYDDCTDLLIPEIKLSACSPTATVFLPRGKGAQLGTNDFKYTDCKWTNENLAWWLAEKISFGAAQNGIYTCVERNGMYSEVTFKVNLFGDGLFELPFDLDRAIAFYPLIEESPARSQVILKLDSGEIKQYYWVEQFEVTQGSYYSVTGKLPSAFIGIASRPVEQVTWFDAVRYCNLRSIKEGLTPVYDYSGEEFHPTTGACLRLSNLKMDIRKNGYRLMTIKEWKQANKAGLNQHCHWGPQPGPEADGYCWYSANSNSATHPVGLKKPNAWGLFDMGGNVEEWTWDRESSLDTVIRVSIGGGYHNPDTRMCGYSANNSWTTQKSHIGFRVIRSAADLTPMQMLLD